MPGRVPGAGCFFKLLPSERTIIHINGVDKNEGLLRGEKGKGKNERKEEKIDILCAVTIAIFIILIPVAVKLDKEIQRKNVKEIFQISQQELFTERPVRIDGTQDLQSRFDALMQTCNRVKLPDKDFPIRITKISRYEYVRDINRTVCILYLENGEIYITDLSRVAFY